MIDKKKIEKAADKYVKETCTEDMSPVTKVTAEMSFHKGIDWFLDNLWHPTSEEPKKTNQENEFVECLVRFKDGIVCLYNYDTWHHWWCSDEDNQKFLGLIDKWLYIDDLLPKEEDGNEKE